MPSPTETKPPSPLHALEWLAVRAGVKPASRHLLTASEGPAVEVAARADGLVTSFLWSRSYLRGFRTRTATDEVGVVFVGKSSMAVARAASAEVRTMALRGWGCWLHGGPSARSDATVELGLALGYPPCCARFFARYGHRESNAALRARALQSTEGPPDWRLNNANFADALISHFVCNYRCDASVVLADTWLGVVSREHPDEATRLTRLLQTTLPTLGSA